MNRFRLMALVNEGHKYHASWCHHMLEAANTEKRTVTVKEIRAENLKPCGKCNPPMMDQLLEELRER